MKKKMIDFIIKYRWAIVILLPLVCIGIFALNVHKAEFETDWKMWFDEDSHIVKNYDHFKDSFGTDDMAIIVIHNEKGVFNRAQIKNIEKLTNLLWQTKSISRVDSLTNFQHVRVSEKDEDEIIVEDLFKKGEELTPQSLQIKKNIALSEPDLVDRIVSKDGKTTFIIGRMVYSKKMEVNKYLALHETLEDMVKNNALENSTYILAGIPTYTNAFSSTIKDNMSFFSPLLFISVLILLAIIFRNIWGVLLPLFVIILTILSTLGISFMLGYQLNTMTSMLPIFIIAIGIADSVHFIWLWIHQRREGKENEEAVLYALEKNMLPAFLTSITTFFGFISLAISKIIPLQAFGISTALGVVIAFLISVSFVPAFLYIIKPRIKLKKIENEKVAKLIQNYTNFIINHDKIIVFASVFVILICTVGVIHVSVNTDFLEQFDKQSQIRKDVEFIEKKLGGTIGLETIIDSKKKNGINEPKFLALVEKFANEFKDKFEPVTNNHSVINVVKKYEQLMHGGKEEFYKIPNSKDLVSQYLLLYSLSLPQGMGVNDMFDISKRYLRLTNMMKATNELQKMQMYDWTTKWWDKTEYSATLEGSTIISSYIRIELTYTLIKSILLALFLVTVILFVSFRKKLYIIASMIPNLLPLLLTFGLAGWLAINIDLGIAIVAVMIIGIAVDDTIHFLAKYQNARKMGKSVKESIEFSLLLGGSAIVFTTIILVVGFGLFILSDFAVYKNFGFLSSVALLSAMVLDLFFLPALLNILEKK